MMVGEIKAKNFVAIPTVLLTVRQRLTRQCFRSFLTEILLQLDAYTLHVYETFHDFDPLRIITQKT